MSLRYVETEYQEKRDPENEPYKSLWAAVVHQAVDDLNGRGDLYGRTGCNAQRFRAERRRLARDWIQSPSIEVGSFLWACGQLGIDAGAAQQHILRADKEPSIIAETAQPLAPPAATVHEIVPLRAPLVLEKFRAPKVRNKAMNNGNGHDDIETLKATVQRFGAELAAAERVVARLKPAVTYLTGAIAALEATNPERVETRNWSRRKVLAAIPKKFPYIDVPLIEAIQTEIRKSSEPIHHDQLIEAIFEIPDANNFRRARSTLLSTLRHGNGRWTRLRDGRYTRGAAEGVEPGLAAAR